MDNTFNNLINIFPHYMRLITSYYTGAYMNSQYGKFVCVQEHILQSFLRAFAPNMSFVTCYRPVINYLFLVGLCPFVVNSTTDQLRLQCSPSTRGYNSAFLFVIIGLTTILMCFRISALFALNDKLNVYLIASTLELTIIAIAYFSTIFESILTGINHANFLMEIVTIDCKLEHALGAAAMQSSLHQSSFYACNMFEMFFISGFFSTAMIYTNTQMIDAVSHSFDFILYGLFNFILVSMFSLMQHVRFCARVLCARHRLINLRLTTILTMPSITTSTKDVLKLLDIFDDLLNLREKFKNVFQFGLLLNTSFDLVIVIITGFLVWSLLMTFGFSIAQMIPLIASLFGSFVMIPTWKCVMLVMALTQMGQEVRMLEILSRKK